MNSLFFQNVPYEHICIRKLLTWKRLKLFTCQITGPIILGQGEVEKWKQDLSS